MRCDEILALDEFHHQRRDAVGVFKAVNRRDVRMVQRREDFGFALEAREALGVRGEDVGQDLDRDLAFQLRVRRAIDLAHAAGADLRRVIS